MENSTYKPRKRDIFAIVVGNGLEWLDYSLYAALALILQKVYFPTVDGYVGILLTFGTYAMGFLVRPFGGLLIAHYADVKSRKNALVLIFLLMGLSIVIMLLTPPYEKIGIAAPLLILLARLIQGFAAGGEFASATAFLVEVAPDGAEGLYGSWQMVGQGVSMFLGIVTGFALTAFFTREELIAGAWRIPYLVALMIVPVGIWARHSLDEPAQAVHARAIAAKSAALKSVVDARRFIVATFLLSISLTVPVQIFVHYMPVYLVRKMQFTLHQSFTSMLIGLIIMLVLTPICGRLSDRYGRKQVMIPALIIFGVLIYPLFTLVAHTHSTGYLTLTYILLSACLGGLFGPFSTAMAEQFKVHSRSLSLAIAYNVAVMVFGGFGIMFVTWLVNKTSVPIAPAAYLIGSSVLGVIGAAMLRPDQSGRIERTKTFEISRVEV